MTTYANTNDEPKFCALCEKHRDAIFYAMIGAESDAEAAALKTQYDSPCTHLDGV
jgi:hypothetical protein